jgi:drug/metabolite transporter (DMT)-like permease
VSLLLIAAILFTIGAGLILVERPGWSKVGFALEFVAGIIALVTLLT